MSSKSFVVVQEEEMKKRETDMYLLEIIYQSSLIPNQQTQHITPFIFLLKYQKERPWKYNTELVIVQQWLVLNGEDPDGTPNTFYSTTGTYSLPQGTKGRYFQYRVNFTGDTEHTPLLEELVVSYEK